MDILSHLIDSIIIDKSNALIEIHKNGINKHQEANLHTTWGSQIKVEHAINTLKSSMIITHQL